MNDIKKRLIGCMHIVFPDVPESSIPLLSQATAENWDSVAAITLMNVLEDEFGIEMDLDRIAELNSFDTIYAYLEQQLKASQPCKCTRGYVVWDIEQVLRGFIRSLSATWDDRIFDDPNQKVRAASLRS